MPGVAENVLVIGLWGGGVVYATALGLSLFLDGLKGLRNRPVVVNSFARIWPLFVLFLLQTVWLAASCAVFGLPGPICWSSLVLLLVVVWLLVRERKSQMHLILYNLDEETVLSTVRQVLDEEGIAYEQDGSVFHLEGREGGIAVDGRPGTRYAAVSFALEAHEEVRAKVARKLKHAAPSAKPSGPPLGGLVDMAFALVLFAAVVALALGVVRKLTGA